MVRLLEKLVDLAAKSPHSMCYLAVLCAVLAMLFSSTGWHPLGGFDAPLAAQAASTPNQ